MIAARGLAGQRSIQLGTGAVLGREAGRADSAGLADAAPFLDERDAAEQVGLDVQGIEAAHVAGLIRGPSSNGTETPIERLSGGQNGQRTTNGLPLCFQHRPSKERIQNNAAWGQLLPCLPSRIENLLLSRGHPATLPPRMRCPQN